MTHSVPSAFMMNAVGTECVTPGYRGCSGYVMSRPWVTEDAVGMEWVPPGLPRMQWVRNGSRLAY